MLPKSMVTMSGSYPSPLNPTTSDCNSPASHSLNSNYHPRKMSHRHHRSTDSSASIRPSTSPQHAPRDVPAAVAALLDATRRLEVALQMWSTLQTSGDEVSDIFVTVGNEYHIMLAAFAGYDIDMSDVASFLLDLRSVLEECLSDDPTPQNVNFLMSNVRRIIANLLIGLRNRQAAYWQAVRAAGNR